MIRKIVILATMLVIVLAFAACAASPATPIDQETGSTETGSTETGDTETVAQESASEEATEAPAEEAAAEGESTSYTVDVVASELSWFGSKPIGETETGTIAIAEGAMNFVGDQLIDGAFIIDMTTIETDSQSGGMAEMLVDHLSSDDFFGIETYATATLVLTSAEPTEAENQYLVTADLTIKETTKQIEFITDVVVSEGTITAAADIVIDRAEFDVQYGSGAFFSGLGDNLISDEIEMTVSLVANS